MQKRTQSEWKDHELIIEKHETHTVHWLKKPNTITCNVKFTNIHGQLLVTGDYKSWIFCREFYPSSKGSVSDHYWCEKLSIANHRMEYKYFSPEITRERILEEVPQRICEDHCLSENMEKPIKEIIDGDNFSLSSDDIQSFCDENEIDHTPELEEDLEYWHGCMRSADDEYEYVEQARKVGDMESAIFGKEIDGSLLCVFDAFDEICRRMEEK